MSHELRTPLNAIIGFSQVLRERMFGELNEKQEEYLDDILASAYHLLSLINDVLDLSKVEAGQIELEIAPFSLRDALESGVVMVRERASDDGVRVELSADPEIDPVEGDERRIRQVVFNLLVERGQVHSGGRRRGRERVPVERRGLGLRLRHGSRSLAGRSRPDLRGVPADRRWCRARAKERASASRSRNGSSSCTAAASGSTARSGWGARSSSRSPRGRDSDGSASTCSSSRTTR